MNSENLTEQLHTAYTSMLDVLDLAERVKREDAYKERLEEREIERLEMCRRETTQVTRFRETEHGAYLEELTRTRTHRRRMLSACRSQTKVLTRIADALQSLVQSKHA